MAQSYNQPRGIDLLAAAGVTSLAVASEGTGVAYSQSFKLPFSAVSQFTYEYKFTSDGTVNVGVELQQFSELPTTEGSADASWVVPDGLSTLATVTDENMHVDEFNPKVTKFARFRFDGLTGNAATTAITHLKVYITS